MLTITSKIITADFSNPGIGILNDPFYRLRDPYKQKYDTGAPKKNQLNNATTAVGGDSRPGNQGAGFSESADVDKHEQERSPQISSGYDDGRRADDETLPGQGKRVTDENTNPYFATTWAFDNPSGPFTFNEIYGKDDSVSARQHLNRVNQGKEIYPRHRK